MTDHPTPEAPSLVEMLERLHESMTPGPWRVTRQSSTSVESDDRGVAACGGYFSNMEDAEGLHSENDSNASGIAALRNALPELIAALRAADEMREERDKLREANRTLGIDLCDEHLGAKEPSPGCWLCEIDDLRTRLVDEHEGSAATEDARLWEQRAHEKEQEADALREACARLREQKGGAYSERNRLVAALSAEFPASLERHPDEDESWEDDWRWIVFIDLPTGQATWHIHDSELPLFAHLPRGQGRKWDGHSTEEKYERLARLNGAHQPSPDASGEVG